MFGLLAIVSAAGAEPPQRPLKVVLIPADGGTEDGTRADFSPVFNAISRSTGFTFDIRVGQSYAAAVEAMCTGAADIAFLGPVTYVQAQQRGCAELLAVSVQHGKSTYYAGIFSLQGGPVKTLADMKERRIAYGDINSTTSFVYPVVMTMDAGLDPVKDFSEVLITGSHANSLQALLQGQADAAALSFESFDKALQKGVVDATKIRIVARSAAIPNPPISVNSRLPAGVKAKLRNGFANLARTPGISPDQIRGYGGEKVDGYAVDVTNAMFAETGATLARVNDGLKAALLKKASGRRGMATP